MMTNINYTAERNNTSLQRGRIILRKGSLYLHRDDSEQYELLDYVNEENQVMVRNVNTRITKIVSIHSLENLKFNERDDISVDLSDI